MAIADIFQKGSLTGDWSDHIVNEPSEVQDLKRLPSLGAFGEQGRGEGAFGLLVGGIESQGHA